ncbi:MAG: AAA family ATPase [Magnetococcales bacterium]|nr:AAA family ATPase [Magnetococcales bacterium]
MTEMDAGRDETEDRGAHAARLAYAVWQMGLPATDDNPYLRRKGVAACTTLRELPLETVVGILGYAPRDDRELLQGRSVLLVPIGDGHQNMASLCLMDAAGRKHFLTRGRVTGCFWSASPLPTGDALGVPVLLGVGIATCLSVRMAISGVYCVAALGHERLPEVARVLRQWYADAMIILLADLDPGSAQPDRFAVQAAREVDAALAIPVFGGQRQAYHTTFNDVHHLYGLKAVRTQVGAARIRTSAQDPGSLEARYRCLADVEAESIQWLWPGRIAKRKLTLEAGDPGLGKSQISLDHAAIVSTGGQWHDGAPCTRAGNVIIISVEDDPGDTIKPRLLACGADMHRVFILEAICDTDNKGHMRERGFNLQEDLGRLEALITHLGGADLIIIDPISAYVGKADSYRNSDVRALLGPLTELASRHEAAVVAVSHLAKSGSSALTKISGSLGFIAAARAGYLIARDPVDKERRLFLPVKNNVGGDADGFAFRITPVTLSTGIETSRVVWEPDRVTLTADEVLAATCANPEDRNQLEEAKEFLLLLLQHGQVEANSIKKQAQEAGIADMTLRRARWALGIKPRKGIVSGKWLWGLPVVTEQPVRNA